MNIPIPNIPNITHNDGIKVDPKMLILFYNNFFKKTKHELDIDKNIEIENHRKIDHFEHYHYMFYKIQKNFYNELNNNKYWISILNKNVCDFKTKNGKNGGNICGRIIEIKYIDGKNHFKCAQHISKKYHIPKPTIIDKEKKCLGINKYNEPCGFSKKYGNLCIHHYAKNNDISINNVNKYYNLQKNISIIDSYENNGYKDIKLICYNNENKINNETKSSINIIPNNKRKNNNIFSNTELNKKIKLNINIKKKKNKNNVNIEILNINQYHIIKNTLINIITIRNIIYKENKNITYTLYNIFNNILQILDAIINNLDNLYYNEFNSNKKELS